MSDIRYPKFKERNILFELDRSDKIYKYFPVKYLQSLVGGTLRLDCVTSWEDIYELFFLRQNFQNPNGDSVGMDWTASGFFGQSWTLLPESDAMWRIYSEVDRKGNPGKDVAVRLSTTVGKLFDAIYTSDINMVNTWIGRVQYRAQGDINNRIAEISQKPISANGDFRDLALESAFTKRNEFAHEQEVRPIFWGDTEYVNTRILHTIPVSSQIFAPFEIDFHSLIDEVTLDPRLNKNANNNLLDRLCQMGIRPSIITQSPLYRLPSPLTITFC